MCGVGFASCEQNGLPSGVVETRTKVLDDLRSQDSPLERKSLSQSDFVSFVDAIRVRLNDTGVWLFSEKARNLGLEVLEMFLCARNP